MLASGKASEIRAVSRSERWVIDSDERLTLAGCAGPVKGTPSSISTYAARRQTRLRHSQRLCFTYEEIRASTHPNSRPQPSRFGRFAAPLPCWLREAQFRASTSRASVCAAVRRLSKTSGRFGHGGSSDRTARDDPLRGRTTYRCQPTQGQYIIPTRSSIDAPNSTR